MALNKWLKPQVPDGCVIHSFRHSLRDRLRAIECPADIINAIGGWVTEGVGHQYGKGHRLTVMHGWMERFQGDSHMVTLLHDDNITTDEKIWFQS